MKHLGEISKVNGAEIEPVDIITFGSPCQDLSVAGRRAGIDGARSGLFMEAVRIIKEMREATDGKYPRFALWENVPGAFSSNKGEDFRVVLEELIKIAEPSADMLEVPPFGWAYADSYIGDGWSLAYRVFDTQYWPRTPQRRRRIYLVADFGGQRAREILFEREGLRRNPAEGTPTGERTATYVEGNSGAADQAITDSVETTAVYWDGTQTCGTLTASNAGGSQRMPDKENFNCVIALDRAFYNQGKNAQYMPQYYTDGTVPTFVAKGPAAVCAKYKVRRLTPTECARLQGFPDTWGHPDKKTSLSDEEYEFWLAVRNTHAAFVGKSVKEYTKDQMLKWYSKLHSDSAEYKMWGNGIALPPSLYCMQGIEEALRDEK